MSLVAMLWIEPRSLSAPSCCIVRAWIHVYSEGRAMLSSRDIGPPQGSGQVRLRQDPTLLPLLVAEPCFMARRRSARSLYPDPWSIAVFRSRKSGMLVPRRSGRWPGTTPESAR